MKATLVILITIHALIHLIGLYKSLQTVENANRQQEISIAEGGMWLLDCLLLFIALSGFLLEKDWWLFVTVTAVVISQILIAYNWADAKYGTIMNILLLLFSFLLL